MTKKLLKVLYRTADIQGMRYMLEDEPVNPSFSTVYTGTISSWLCSMTASVTVVHWERTGSGGGLREQEKIDSFFKKSS